MGETSSSSAKSEATWSTRMVFSTGMSNQSTVFRELFGIGGADSSGMASSWIFFLLLLLERDLVNFAGAAFLAEASEGTGEGEFVKR